MANGVNDPVGGLNAALTPEQIAGLQASAALMQGRIQAASDPNRNAAFDKYVADQAAKGIEVASTYTGGGGPLGSGGVLGVTDFAPAFDPANPAGTTGQVVRFDPQRMNAPVVFQPGQQYVLTDASGEGVIGRASSVEELQKLAAAKESMPYGFQLYRADEQGQYQPGTQLFGETDPRTKGLMGAFVNYGLPIAAGIATGGLSLIPAMAASAAASGAAKLMTGYTPEDAAKAAAIAGATRGVLKGTGLEDALGNFLGGGSSGVSPGEAAAAKLGYAGGLLNKAGILTDVAGNVVATGVGTPAAVLAGNVAGGALQTVTGSLGSAIAPAVIGAGTGAILGSGTTGPLTTVTGTSPNANIGAAVPAVVGTTPVLGTGAVGQQVTVSGQTDKPAEIGGALPAVVGTTPVMGTGTVGQQVTVSGQTDKPAEIGGALPAVVGTTPVMGTGPVGQQVTVSGQTDKPANIGGALPAVVGTTPVLGTGTVGQQVTVSGETDKPGDIGGKPTDLLAPVIGEFVASDIVGGGKSLEQEQAEKDGEKKDTLDKIADAATIAGLVIPAIGALAGDGKGGGTGTYVPGGGSFDPIFSAKLPTPGEGGAFTVGGLTPNPLAARPTADWYRYAMGPAMDMPAGVDLSAATSPYAGFGPGTLGLEAFNRVTGRAGSEVAPRPTGDLPSRRVGETTVVDGDTYVWGGNQNGWQRQYKDPATGDTKLFSGATNVTSLADMLASGMATQRPANQPYFKQNLTNIPDWANTYRNWQTAMRGAGVPEAERFAAEREFMTALEQRPFGNAKELFDFARGLLDRSRRPKAAARGGPMGYARGSSRESFAVEGPGTGRSDDIPAVLSDGEYVIDAETVALLGDGSSRAGAKKLDELRVKVRKHKGKNLAKGKFSVNAKHPEAYMRGGRI
jgi:hypothetical protein